MQTVEITLADAKSRFSELVNRVAYGGERIVITKRGKPVAILSAASGKGLGAVKGWLSEKDDFFKDLEELEKRRHVRHLRVRKSR